MKLHTTNYQDTFIEISDDCPVLHGQEPPSKGDAKSIASIQYAILKNNPYKFTSDDVLFEVFAQRKELGISELAEARADFFSKGQPCFRTSPLTKRYGWGIHHDQNGKIAMVGRESVEYEKLSHNKVLTVVKAMRASRK